MLFPEFSDLAPFWRDANSGTDEQRFEAARYLAGFRRWLPGVVFVKMPRGLDGAARSELENLTFLLCECGERRLLTPEKGRTRFLVSREASVVEVVPGEAPLYLAPWGGDPESTFMKISVKGSALFIRPHPFRGQMPLAVQSNILVGDGASPRDEYFDLFELQNLIRSRGPQYCLWRAGRVDIPVCRILNVEKIVGVWRLLVVVDMAVKIPTLSGSFVHHRCRVVPGE